MNNNNNNNRNRPSDQLFQQSSSAPRAQQLKNKSEISLATAMVLIEVAGSDRVIDRVERSIIHAGLKNLFKLSDEAANALFTKAQAYIRDLRSPSLEAAKLRDALDLGTRQQIAQIIDNLIRCNGSADSMEHYLRQRFRELLGLPDEPLSFLDQ
jgi:uncharacterized tellurite resistance protein B-like protein